MEKFLIVDGNSILNRAFYGLAAARMTATDGMPTNAIFGFLNIYYMIVEKFTPDYVAVAFDLKAPTFRHKMYKEYKGTRKGMPDELKVQVPVIKDVLRAMNIHIFELEGYEADDILGTVSKKNEENGIFTYLLTGDRDTYQLISDTTNVIYPSSKMGKTDYTIYTPNLLKEEKGIEPYQVVDIKSLMGDASDNIPGVKGIGEKTAYTLIGKYTTMENIYKNIDSLDASPKVIEKIKNDEEMARLSYTLATINRDVPITLDYAETKIKEVNKEALYTLFKKLSFNKFLARYNFDADVKDSVEIKTKDNSLSIDEKNIVLIDNLNFKNYKEMLLDVLQEEKISYILNVNYEGVTHTSIVNIDKVSFLSLYSPKQDKVYCINLSSFNKDYTSNNILENNSKNNVDTDIVDIVLKNFATSKSIKLGYNIKQDIRFIFTYISSEISNFSYDLLLACYLLDSTRNFKFDGILSDLFGVILDFEKDTKKSVQISLFDDEIGSESTQIEKDTLKEIAIATKGIYLSQDIIDEKLRKDDMYSLMYDIEIPLSETLASMEKEGMYVNKEKLEEFDTVITKRIKELEDEIYTLAGEEFNINSTQQLGTILFDKLHLPTKKKTKTGYSTSKEVLEELEAYHEIIPCIIEYRQTMKLKSTYVDGLEDKIGKDSRIHTTFMQTVTATGRLSSVDPNLQNIPIRLELGSKIRTFFTAPEGKIIVDADYSQIELRILSHIAKDETMQYAFKEGIDVHSLTASQVFGVPLDEVTHQMRSNAKAVNFGIVYGISEFGLSKNAGITFKEAKDYINKYLTTYKGIYAFMKDIVVEAKEKGYVTTLFKRRRYIPELKNKNKNMVQFGERIAMNTPIQGTAADIIKIAMNNLYRKLKENNLKSKLVMQVHDELIVETYKDEEDIVKRLLKEAMENVISLDIPLDISLNSGKSWYDAK